MRNRDYILRAWLAIIVSFAVVLLTVQGSFAQSYADSSVNDETIKQWVINVNGHKVIKQIAYRPSEDDKHWPIVYSRKWSSIDVKTGEEIHYYMEIRRSPSKLLQQSKCNVSTNTTGMLTSNCHYKFSYHVYTEATRGWVTAHVKHYFHRYKRYGDTVPYYDPWKVEMWWTRGNASWTVKDARLEWGCESCWKCEDGWHGYVFWDGPFDPGWNSNNTSWVYRYISEELFRPMKEMAADIQAVSYSNVYKACGGTWCFVDEIVAIADLPDQ